MKSPNYEMNLIGVQTNLRNLLTDSFVLQNNAETSKEREKIKDLRLAIENALDIVNEVKGMIKFWLHVNVLNVERILNWKKMYTGLL